MYCICSYSSLASNNLLLKVITSKAKLKTYAWKLVLDYLSFSISLAFVCVFHSILAVQIVAQMAMLFKFQNDPDYSCVYVTVTASSGLQGHGLTFTIGRGNEIGNDALYTTKVQANQCC